MEDHCSIGIHDVYIPPLRSNSSEEEEKQLLQEQLLQERQPPLSSSNEYEPVIIRNFNSHDARTPIRAERNAMLPKYRHQNNLVDPSVTPVHTWTSTPLDPVVVFPWSRRIEEYLSHLASICKRNRELHSASYHYYRRWGNIWGIPPIIIPLIFSPLIPVVKSRWGGSCEETDISDLLTLIGFIATSVTSGVSSYFGFNALATLHEVYSAKYSELHTDVEAMFLPPKKFRQSPEVFLASLRIKYDHLVSAAPNIPLALIKAYQQEPNYSPAFINSDF